MIDRFRTQSALRFHRSQVHTDRLPLMCEKCGKGFPNPTHLARHIEAHDVPNSVLEKRLNKPPVLTEVRLYGLEMSVCPCPENNQWRVWVSKVQQFLMPILWPKDAFSKFYFEIRSKTNFLKTFHSIFLWQTDENHYKSWFKILLNFNYYFLLF